MHVIELGLNKLTMQYCKHVETYYYFCVFLGMVHRVLGDDTIIGGAASCSISVQGTPLTLHKDPLPYMGAVHPTFLSKEFADIGALTLGWPA